MIPARFGQDDVWFRRIKSYCRDAGSVQGNPRYLDNFCP